MNRKLQQILKQLIKLFPDKHIDIKVSHNYYRHSKMIVTTYSLYIEDYVFSNNKSAWSIDFNDYNVFISYLNSTFGNVIGWKVIKFIS